MNPAKTAHPADNAESAQSNRRTAIASALAVATASRFAAPFAGLFTSLFAQSAAAQEPFLSEEAAKAATAAGVLVGYTRELQHVRVTEQVRTTGMWFYRAANADQVRGFSHWKPNATQLPAVLQDFDERGAATRLETRWEMGPELRQAHDRMVEVLKAGEPRPQFRHLFFALSPVFSSRETNRVARGFSIALSRQMFAFDAGGKLDPEGVPDHGIKWWDYFKISANTAFPFEFEEGLSYEPVGQTRSNILPTGRWGRVGPSADESGGRYRAALDEQLRRAGLKFPAAELPIIPKGVGTIAHASVRPSLRWLGDGKDHYVATRYTLLLTPEGRFPASEFMTRGQLFDVLESLGNARLARTQEFVQREALPTDAAQLKRQLERRASLIEEHTLPLRMLAHARSLYASSLAEVAIINPTHYGDIATGRVVLISREHDARTRRPNTKPDRYALESMFVSDPAQGFRLGKPTRGYYNDRKPGEVRLILIELETKWRLPSSAQHGKHPAPYDLSAWADVPNTLHHSFLNNFNWDAIKALLGDGPLS